MRGVLVAVVMACVVATTADAKPRKVKLAQGKAAIVAGAKKRAWIPESVRLGTCTAPHVKVQCRVYMTFSPEDDIFGQHELSWGWELWQAGYVKGHRKPVACSLGDPSCPW